MSRFDVSDTVRIALRAVRGRPQAARARSAYASRFGRYCGNIRWMQSWIVTTDAAGHQRRQHVVRRVEQVDVLPDAAAPAACDLLGDRVAAATARRRPGSSAPSSSASVASCGRQSSTYSVVLVDAGQVLQQVPDVGADAEVVQFPGVDGDAHVGVSSPGSRYHRACRAGVAHGRPRSAGGSAPRSAQVRAQQRRPARVVLLVERELAAPVRAARSPTGASAATRPRRCTTSRVGREQDAAPERAQRRAEIHVLRVEEVPLVEQAGGQRHRRAAPAGTRR